MNKIAHLEMIQGVVNRLSHDSFLLKGWNVVLVAAIFALAARESTAFFIPIAFLPAVVFWGLDGYFLWQERLFRKLYDLVRELPELEIDFSMDTSEVSDQVSSWEDVLLSVTLLSFHGSIVIAIIMVTIVSLIWK